MARKYLFYTLSAILLMPTTAYKYETNKNPNSVHGYRTEAGFEIVSGRNSTGHWNSNIRFTHSANKGPIDEENEYDAWKLIFDQRIDVVEEGEKISLFAAVTIPPASAAVLEPVQPTDDRTVVPRQSFDTVIRHGYLRVEGLGYYKFHAEPLTWYGALLKCQAETAHLLVINSQEEARIVRNMFNDHPVIYASNNNNLAFVGVNDLENEGVYVTIFGELLQDAGYKNWETNQPNNYGNEPPGEDCLATNRESKYYDWECYHKLAFICEKSF